MGCDIHWVLERKFGHKWVGITHEYAPVALVRGEKAPQRFGDIAGERDYVFFSALADVRTRGGVPGPDAKGLPDDASELSRAQSQRWDGDGHSHSWNSLAEFAALKLANSEELAGELMRRKMEGEDRMTAEQLLFAGLDDDEDEDEYRVVYWFDN